MIKLKIHTKKHKQVMDITDQIQLAIQQHNVSGGLVHVFITHSMAALTTTKLDPSIDLDMLDAFEHMMPKPKNPDPQNPTFTSERMLSMIIGNSIHVPIDHGRMVLGMQQRVVIVELNGPKEREVVITFHAESTGR